MELEVTKENKNVISNNGPVFESLIYSQLDVHAIISSTMLYTHKFPPRLGASFKYTHTHTHTNTYTHSHLHTLTPTHSHTLTHTQHAYKVTCSSADPYLSITSTIMLVSCLMLSTSYTLNNTSYTAMLNVSLYQRFT